MMHRPDVRGIRFRATALVTVILAVALIVGSLTIASVLRQRLEENLDSTLLAAASDRAVLLADRADPATLTDTRLEESLIWIGTADGEQIAQGGRFLPLDGIPGLSLDVVGTVQTIDVLFEERYDDEDEEDEIETEALRLGIDAVVDGDQTIYVVVGSETEVIDQPINDVLLVEAIIGPALLALVAALTWVTADRALRPVESIRSSAASIRHHREAAQVEVPDTGDEIERLATTINEMLGRLAAADERQRRFIGDASHELKSPLANLRMEIDIGESPDRGRHLAQIDRLTALVDDLLVLSVLDADRPLRADRVDLDDIVFDVLAASARPDTLAIDIDGVTPTRVVGDGGQLRRLVRNLVDNANRHAASRVAVQLAERDGVVTLHVDDDGSGIEPEAREVIFERFGTLSSSRARAEGGTGLGLAIAARIVEGHGGSIVVERSDIGGARFTVVLPADATDAAQTSA